MVFRRDESWQQEAAEAHAAHERAEQHTDRHRRGPDEQLQQLEPDDLVDERRATAADKQQQQDWKPLFCRVCVGCVERLCRRGHILPANTSARWTARLSLFWAICSRQLNPSVTITVPGPAARTARSSTRSPSVCDTS